MSSWKALEGAAPLALWGAAINTMSSTKFQSDFNSEIDSALPNLINQKREEWVDQDGYLPGRFLRLFLFHVRIPQPRSLGACGLYLQRPTRLVQWGGTHPQVSWSSCYDLKVDQWLCMSFSGGIFPFFRGRRLSTAEVVHRRRTPTRFRRDASLLGPQSDPYSKRINIPTFRFPSI